MAQKWLEERNSEESGNDLGPELNWSPQVCGVDTLANLAMASPENEHSKEQSEFIEFSEEFNNLAFWPKFDGNQNFPKCISQ